MSKNIDIKYEIKRTYKKKEQSDNYSFMLSVTFKGIKKGKKPLKTTYSSRAFDKKVTTKSAANDRVHEINNKLSETAEVQALELAASVVYPYLEITKDLKMLTDLYRFYMMTPLDLLITEVHTLWYVLTNEFESRKKEWELLNQIDHLHGINNYFDTYPMNSFSQLKIREYMHIVFAGIASLIEKIDHDEFIDSFLEDVSLEKYFEMYEDVKSFETIHATEMDKFRAFSLIKGKGVLEEFLGHFKEKTYHEDLILKLVLKAFPNNPLTGACKQKVLDWHSADEKENPLIDMNREIVLHTLPEAYFKYSNEFVKQ